MKALLSTKVGGPEALELGDLPAPEAGPGLAVLDVKACGVNFPDVLIIQDKYQFKPPRPFAPGSEVAGIVTRVGEGVTEVAVGDRVLGSCGAGGMAEEIALPAGRLFKVPDEMPLDEAAAFLLTYGTSYHALADRGRLRTGETLLVLGAAGGVGLAAVELGKALGARVIAACSSQEKLDLARAHGADGGMIYGRGPFDGEGRKQLSEAFKSACGPEGPNVIYDAVGGDYAEPAFRSIAWEGRYLVVGFAAGEIPRLPLNLALLKGADVVGVFYGAWAERDPAGLRRNTEALMTLYRRGKVRPHVSERFPLERGAEAIARLADRKAMGKVVVTID